MKLTYLALGMSLSLFLTSCGEEKTSETETTEKTENATEEVAVKMNMPINLSESVVAWEGNMVSVLGVSLYGHTGTVGLTEASLEMTGDNITGGQFKVDLNQMATTDQNYSAGGTSEMLIGHLKSPDFFDVPNFSEATYVIKKSEGMNVVGDLTIKGITKEVSAKVLKADKANGVLEAELVFNRQDFGVAYVHSAKDKLVADDIKLTIKLIAQK